MDWLALLRVILGLANHLATYLNNKELLDAGEAKAIAEGLKNAQDAVTRARKARSNAVRKFDESNGMPDDEDPNLRD